MPVRTVRRGPSPANRRDPRLLDESALEICPLDPNYFGEEVETFRRGLQDRVIGQQSAVDAVTQAYQIFSAGLAPNDRPLGSFLFLGPTGTGKTNLVEALAEVCFGDRRAMLKVDCGEYSHSHEVARLTGSPPGYLGHQETHPYLSQENVNRYQTPRHPFTLLLFDEIEKANDSLWQLLLGVLDKARLTLGNNKEVDLSSCFIFLTSNVGSRSISEIVSPGMGFATGGAEPEESLQGRIEKAVLWKARRTFAPEFLNRIDHKVVFHRLEQSHLDAILSLELDKIERRLARRAEHLGIDFTGDAREFLLERGTDPDLGARPLKRILEQHAVFPLARMLASGQLDEGEQVIVDLAPDRSELGFQLRRARVRTACAG